MENNDTPDSPSTPRNNFQISVHSPRRGWTLDPSFSFNVDSIRTSVCGYDVYVFLHNDKMGPIGVRVMKDGQPVSTFVAGGCCSENMHGDEAESYLNSLTEEE